MGINRSLLTISRNKVVPSHPQVATRRDSHRLGTHRDALRTSNKARHSRNTIPPVTLCGNSPATSIRGYHRHQDVQCRTLWAAS
jgi:hypothetical protein